MRTEIVEERPAKPSILKRGLAGVILIAAVALAVKLVIGFVMAIFWVIVAVAIVIAIIWALKTIL